MVINYQVIVVSDTGMLVSNISGVQMTVDEAEAKASTLRMGMTTTFRAADGTFMTVGADLAKKTSVIFAPTPIGVDPNFNTAQKTVEGEKNEHK